jgi:hypothetical protein
MKGSLECPQSLAQSIGSHKEVPCCNPPRDTVVADGGQRHRSDTAALFAIGISSKLAGSDLCPKIGGNGFRSSRKNAFFWTPRWKLDLSNESFGHIQGGILQTQLSQVGYGRSPL